MFKNTMDDSFKYPRHYMGILMQDGATANSMNAITGAKAKLQQSLDWLAWKFSWFQYHWALELIYCFTFIFLRRPI